MRKIAIGTVIGTVATVGVMLYGITLTRNQADNQPRMLQEDQISDEVTKQFNDFVSTYHRSYLTKAEYQARLQVFKANYEAIQHHNSLNESQPFQLGLNQFADWTLDEYLLVLINMTIIADDPKKFLNNENEKEEKEDQNVTSLTAPQSIDWRNQGAVTSVQDQGKCSGCYAFAAAAAMESAYKIKTGKLHEFSPQQLIDCTKGFRNAGCKGGFMTNCYKYLQDNPISKSSDYPYMTSDTQPCESKINGVTKTLSYTEVPKKNPQALLEAVAKQPVSVGISAFCQNMMLYKGGVLTKGCGSVLNHAVVIVGYGNDSQTGLDYWLVKNTWGTKWGESGYVRMVRSMVQGDPGLNGITTLASYPNV